MHLQVADLKEDWYRARLQRQFKEFGDPFVREEVIPEQLVVPVEEESCVAGNLNVNELDVS